ncbi:MAG: hypothetical protein ACWA40_10385 [Planktomarina sp.]
MSDQIPQRSIAVKTDRIDHVCAPYFEAGLGWEDVAVTLRALGRDVSYDTIRRVWLRWQS